MSLPIINTPRSVLTYLAPETGLYGAEYIEDRKTRMRALAGPNRVACHQIDAGMVEIFPEWMIEAGPGLLKHTRIRSRLTRDPLLAVQMLLSAYDESQPLLERAVLSSGEATVPLLGAIDDGLILPRGSRETYERPLFDQPWWGLRYLSLPCPSANVASMRAVFAAELKKQCANRVETSPQAALVHLLFNQEADPVLHHAVLSQDPMTAYLASRLLGPRGLEIHLDQVGSLDPRWATHIALWGGFSGGNSDGRIESAIAGHAAWAGEYIARSPRSHKDWPWVQGIYAKVEASFRARASGETDLWADLLWTLLDRLCLKIEGKDPCITLVESLARNSTPADAQSVPAGAQN